ncbi:MAG: alpha-ketoglutarate-dependent dioxygenase AlkB [Acidimicrobiales bacterium]
MALVWQPSLLGDVPPDFDVSFARAERRDLGSGAWLEDVPGWAQGSDALFEALLEGAPWATHERRMYDRMVVEPRLTTRQWDDPPPPLPAMARALSERFEADLSVISANLYRDGRDSVAWHGDRVARTRDETVVAVLSLGSPRRFLLRPKGGGRSLRLEPAPGDLLVLGGTCQRAWEHSVPKRAQAGPRISVMFREEY